MPTSGVFLLTLDARKKPTRGKYIYSSHKAFKRIPGVVWALATLQPDAGVFTGPFAFRSTSAGTV